MGQAYLDGPPARRRFVATWPGAATEKQRSSSPDRPSLTVRDGSAVSGRSAPSGARAEKGAAAPGYQVGHLWVLRPHLRSGARDSSDWTPERLASEEWHRQQR